MCSYAIFEEQWMSDCPIDYKPISYRRYVGDTFLLSSSELNVANLLNYMNSKHRNIFTNLPLPLSVKKILEISDISLKKAFV